MSFDKDAIKQNLKDQLSGHPVKALKAAHDVDPGKALRTGRTAARKAQERQSLLIERQRQREEIKLAESEDEIARRKTLAKSGRGGRRSLIQTSEAGVGATNLGGTT
jgi:hypothetical protein